MIDLNSDSLRNIRRPPVSLSGANVDFVIPAGVKRITLILANVSSNGTNSVGLRLSVGGVFATTGYLASVDILAGSSAPANTTSASVSLSPDMARRRRE